MPTNTFDADAGGASPNNKSDAHGAERSTLLVPPVPGLEHPNSGKDLGQQNNPPTPSPYSELKNLTEAQLKAAVKSVRKQHEPRLRKEMAPLVYWLRVRLRAQGSRNDIHDQDRGFGAWIEKNAGISRATADRWARAYGLANGLIVEETTSNQVSESDGDATNLASKSGADPANQVSESHGDATSQVSERDAFYQQDLDKHPALIQITHRVPQTVHKQWEQALKNIRKHYKIKNDGEAIVKVVLDAEKAIVSESKVTKPSVHTTVAERTSAGDVSNSHGNGRHRGRKCPSPKGAAVG